jgi:hypothetical protein
MATTHDAATSRVRVSLSTDEDAGWVDEFVEGPKKALAQLTGVKDITATAATIKDYLRSPPGCDLVPRIGEQNVGGSNPLAPTECKFPRGFSFEITRGRPFFRRFLPPGLTAGVYVRS